MNAFRPNAFRVVYHMMRADFFERTRRYSFLIMLLAMVYLGYGVNHGDILLYLDDYRGIYNSAWVGALMSLVLVTFLGWFGFYLINNTIDRDERTGVGQIIATTPLTKVQYTLGKWLSNFALLSVLTLILAFAAVIMQLIQREDPVFDLWALLAPFFFVALPMMALVAGAAVLFESIPFLRGGLGNVIYFFLFAFVMVAAITNGKENPAVDPFGVRLLTADMAVDLRQVYPEYDEENFTLGMVDYGDIKTFRWTGMDWTLEIIGLRLAWIGLGAGFAVLAALFFIRFDSSSYRMAAPKRKKTKATEAAAADLAGIEDAVGQTAARGRGRSINFLPRISPNSGFLRLLVSELRLMLQGQRWYWYLGVLIIIGGSLFSPLDAVRVGWLPAAAIWPLLIWSKTGVRENQNNVQAIVFSAPRPLLRLLPATWLSGVLVAALVSLGVGVRWLAAGEFSSLLAWLLFILLAPSLSLVLGVWSRSSKLFEVVYLVLWYLGPLNRVYQIDYLGISPKAVVLQQPWLVALVIAAALALAFVGRKQQVMQ